MNAFLDATAVLSLERTESCYRQSQDAVELSLLRLRPAPSVGAAAAEAEMKRCLGQQPCTQHSAMHSGGTKPSLSVASRASC